MRNYLLLLLYFPFILSACREDDDRLYISADPCYRLPVVFHILHRPGEVAEQAVADRLLVLLREANRFYKGADGTSVDMNVEFVPATHDPAGK